MSLNEGEASFAVLRSNFDFKWNEGEIILTRCEGNGSPIGAKIIGDVRDNTLMDSRIESCKFINTQCAVYTCGNMKGLTLTKNASDTSQNDLSAKVGYMINSDNSWN